MHCQWMVTVIPTLLSDTVQPVNQPPSKHARSDSEAFWLWPVTAIMASMQPELNHMLDPSSCIRFQFHSSKERPGLYCIFVCKTSLDPIWMACSDFGQTHLLRKQASVQESSGPVLAEHHRPTTKFPLSNSVAFLHRWLGLHCA